MSNFLWPPRTAACQTSLSFTVSWKLLQLVTIKSWCYLTISSSVIQFSFCLQSLYKINVIRLVQVNYGFTLLSFGIWCWNAAAAKSLQSCLTLCDPIDDSPPGSPAPGILQARTLEWVASPFSNAWKWKVKGTLLSHVRLLVTPWTPPPSMGFSRQEE